MSSKIIFDGRIHRDPTLDDRGLVNGYTKVLYPKNEQAIAKILKHTFKNKLSVDVSSTSRKTVTPDADVRINITKFNKLTVDGNLVTAGAAAFVGALAAALEDADIFIPLLDRPWDTIDTAVRDVAPGYFKSTIGSLRSFIHQINAVTIEGEIIKVSSNDKTAINDLLDIHCPHIITSIVFKAWASNIAKKVWMARIHVPYTKQSFEKLVKNSFDDPSIIPDGIDITVQTKTGHASFPIVFVTITGMKPSSSPNKFLPKIVAMMYPGKSESVALEHFKIYTGVDVVSATISANDMGGRTIGKKSSFHKATIEKQSAPAFLSKLVSIADAIIGSSDTKVCYFPNISISLRLTKTESGDFSVSGFFLSPRSSSNEEKKMSEEFSNLLPVLRPVVQNTASRSTKANASDIFESSMKTSLIPGFSGVVYTEEDGDDYSNATKQYAKSSYPEEDMTPYMVAYPESIADIQAAISFAIQKSKAIVPRSGGHQYSGLSSGGKDTIVVSMNNFSQIEMGKDGQKNHATVGVGVILDHISTAMRDENAFVPHGQCPTVGIGGHVQSGGYGLALRNFGLLTDYVYSFHIVMADGSYVEVFRPNVDVPSKIVDNDDLFYAVLGGGPGSFGVLTDVTIELQYDTAHPESAGIKGVMSYNKERMQAGMNLMQKWIKQIYDGTLQPDLDCSFTVITVDHINNLLAVLHDLLHPGDDIGDEAPNIQYPLPGIGRRLMPGLIFAEMVYGNHDGESPDPNNTYEMIETEYNKIAEKGGSFSFELKEYEGKVPMSKVMDMYVQRFGTMGDGREFVYPYKKRVNGTANPLSNEFVQGAVEIMDDLMNEKYVYGLLLVNIGGGQFRDNENRRYTGGQRRDTLTPIEFDIFYPKCFEAVAIAYQNRIRKLFVDQVPETDTVRYSWATFEDTHIERVWQYYYDNEEEYQKLQQIKGRVDPGNVFRTKFTVPPQ